MTIVFCSYLFIQTRFVRNIFKTPKSSNKFDIRHFEIRHFRLLLDIYFHFEDLHSLTQKNVKTNNLVMSSINHIQLFG